MNATRKPTESHHYIKHESQQESHRKANTNNHKHAKKDSHKERQRTATGKPNGSQRNTKRGNLSSRRTIADLATRLLSKQRMP